MKLEECKKCQHHMQSHSDSVLCRYEDEINHRVIDKQMDRIVGCPLENKNKKKR